MPGSCDRVGGSRVSDCGVQWPSSPDRVHLIGLGPADLLPGPEVGFHDDAALGGDEVTLLRTGDDLTEVVEALENPPVD